METIEILLIILIDILALIIGLITGRLVALKRQEKKNSCMAVNRNNDWLKLLYYTPGGEINTLKNKKETENERKNRNHTR